MCCYKHVHADGKTETYKITTFDKDKKITQSFNENAYEEFSAYLATHKTKEVTWDGCLYQAKCRLQHIIGPPDDTYPDDEATRVYQLGCLKGTALDMGLAVHQSTTEVHTLILSLDAHYE